MGLWDQLELSVQTFGCAAHIVYWGLLCISC